MNPYSGFWGHSEGANHVSFLFNTHRALFQKGEVLYDKYKGKHVMNYDYLKATSVVDDCVHPCCGLYEIVSWGIKHHGYIDSIQPYREQLVLSETAFCGICHESCPTPADYILHHEHNHLCISLFVCIVCRYPFITCSALQMHITEIHGGPATIQCILSFNYNI